MLAIKPISITSANLDFSSAADQPTWAADTIYAADAVVSLNSIAYKSLADGNKGNAPATSPLYWYIVGASNKMAMFDTSPTTITSGPAGESLVVKFTTGARITAMGMLLVRGATIQLQVYTVKAGLLLYDTGAVAIATSRGTYHSWCFEELLQQPDASFLNLPSYGAATYYVLTITPKAGLAQCGLCAFGVQYDIGAAQYGFNQSAELRGRSYFDSAGNPVRIDRGYRKNIGGTLHVENALYNRIQRFLQDNIGVPMLWILDPDLEDFKSAIMFGDYEKTVLTIDNHSFSLLSIELNGYY
jgi:hypothetical protein